jgi:predicted lipoprotein with Yx(FWY)xxD motif
MRTVALLTACGLVLVGCGSDTTPGTDPPGATTPPTATTAPGGTTPSTQQPTPSNRSTPPPATGGTAIMTANSNFGTILFDGSGQAIYLFDKERSATPECYDACAEAWPPVLTKGSPKALGAVKTSLLGTTRRTDGTTQVTYGGHPLYFYAHEGKNEVKCHNVQGFGGLWLVVTAAGKAAPS